ncbi:MAG: peptidoglycan DD-metalloendopeptidase family protein [Leptolyngbyaceae cyanobacterium]
MFTQEPVQNARSLLGNFASLQDTQGSAEANRVVCTSVTVFGLALSLGASGALFSGVEAADSTHVAYLPSASDIPITLPSYGSDRPSGASANYHTVTEGETIWDIAKRYGIAVEDIKVANSILNGQAIQAGQVLKVPSQPASSAMAVEQPSDQIAVEVAASEPILSSVGSKPSLDEPAAAQLQVPLAEAEGSQPQSITAFVESGEQPDSSARSQLDPKHSMFGESLEPSDVSAAVRPEQIAALPDLSPVQSEMAERLEPSLTPATSEADLPVQSFDAQILHRVQPGETVWSIAYAHGIRPDALRQANQISNPNIIFPGDTLVVPEALSGREVEAESNSSSSSQVSEVAHASSEAAVSTSLPSETLPVSRESEAKALVDGAIPTFDVDATAVESRSVEDVSVVEAPLMQVDTLSLSESESPVLPAASAAIQEEVSPSTAIDFDPSAEASALESTSRVLNTGENLASATNAEGLGVGRGVLGDVRELATSSEQLIAAADSSATVLEADSLEVDEDALDPTDRVLEASEELLAAAPLGSEVYAPVVESPEGRVVSPDLPALPAQGEYLPEAPDQFEGYMWPAQGVLTSGYGWRWGRMHQGVDIAGPVGTPIFSAAAGTVVRSGWNSGGYGNVVDIRHPDGSLTRYAHNSRLLVEEGQEVRQGQQIAEMGSTGYSTGPHLHFEIHLPDQGAVNPSAYLPGR